MGDTTQSHPLHREKTGVEVGGLSHLWGLRIHTFKSKATASGRACCETGQDHFCFQEKPWVAVTGEPVVQSLLYSLKVLVSKPQVSPSPWNCDLSGSSHQYYQASHSAPASAFRKESLAYYREDAFPARGSCTEVHIAWPSRR